MFLVIHLMIDKLLQSASILGGFVYLWLKCTLFHLFLLLLTFYLFRFGVLSEDRVGVGKKRVWSLAGVGLQV